MKRKIISYILLLTMSLSMAFSTNMYQPNILDAVEDVNMRTIYLKDAGNTPNTFENGFYAYLEHTTSGNSNGLWPGEKMEHAGTDIDGNNIYSINVDISMYNQIRFNDGGTDMGMPNHRTQGISLTLPYGRNGFVLTGETYLQGDNEYHRVETTYVEFPKVETLYVEDSLHWGHLYVWLTNDNYNNSQMDNNSTVAMDYVGKRNGKDIYSYTYATDTYTHFYISNGKYGLDNKVGIHKHTLEHVPISSMGTDNAIRLVASNESTIAETTSFSLHESDIDTSDIYTIYFKDSLEWGNINAFVTVDNDYQYSNGYDPGHAMEYIGKSVGDKARIYTYTFASETFNNIQFFSGDGTESTDVIDYKNLLSDVYNTVFINANGDVEPLIIDPEHLDDSDLVTIYYRDDISWGDPYVHAFSTTNTNVNGEIPGQRMHFEAMDGPHRVYTIAIDSEEYDRIIFTDGTAGYTYLYGDYKTFPNRQTDADGINYLQDIEDGFNGYRILGPAGMVDSDISYEVEAMTINPVALQSYIGYQNIDTKVKNVIFMIGDGFGMNHIRATEMWMKEHTGEEYMTFRDPSKTGWSMNWMNVHSASYPAFTDSAAAGTALATGVRTYDNWVGIAPDGRWLENLVGFSSARGLNTGLVVTQTMPHATPAAFSAHTPSRHNDATIANQQLRYDIDVLFGTGWSYYEPNGDKNTYDNHLEIENRNYAYIQDVRDLDNVPYGQKVLGLWSNEPYRKWDAINNDAIPSLAEATEKALDRLQGENGDENFFVMIEGSDIDGASHDVDIKGVIEESHEFHEAVKIAEKYVDENPDTLLIVTADHETGGLDLAGVSNLEELYNKHENDVFGLWGMAVSPTFSTHSGIPVPLFAYGAGADELTRYGVIDNTEIFDYITQVFNNEYGVQPPNIIDEQEGIPRIPTSLLYFQKPDDWSDIYAYNEDTNERIAMVLIDPDNSIYSAPISIPADVDVSNISFTNGVDNKTVSAPAQFENFYAYVDRGQIKYEVYIPPQGVIYFHNTEGWDTVGFYAWGADGEFTSSWPGDEMEYMGDDIYKIVVKDSIASVDNFQFIFNNFAANGAIQSADLPNVGFNTLHTLSERTNSSGRQFTDWIKYPASEDDDQYAGTIYFELPETWSDPHLFLTAGAYVEEAPGVQMEKVEGQDTMYSYTIKKGEMYNFENFQVVFTNGVNTNEQTVNLRFEGFNKVFTVTEGEDTRHATGHWSVVNLSSEVNKDQLRFLIETYADLNEEEYTKESWSVFMNAYTHGELVLDDDDATQQEVDNAVKELLDAIEGLVLKETELEPKPEPTPKPEPKPDPETCKDEEKDCENNLGNIPGGGPDGSLTDGSSNVNTGDSSVLYPFIVLFFLTGTVIGMIKRKIKD